MKKNITINLFGALYNIDEDAYDLLFRYQEDMKRYFAGREGGEEIADDIEHRVAELMAELKASGVEAITIEHIEAIIRRIGSPEQLDGDAEEDDAQPRMEKSRKKLFRNPDDRKLAGVLSGMAAYFGVDPMALRLIALVLIFVTKGVGLLVYLICWLIIPEAKTPEDKLRMRGEPVNMESLREEILNGAGKVEDFVRSPQTESKARGCLSTVLDLFAGLFKLLLFVFLGGLAVLFVFGLLLVICCIGMALYASIAGFGSLFFHNTDAVLLQTLEQLPLTANLGFWVSALSLLVLLAIPVYVFVHWLGRFWGRGGGIAPKARTTLIVSWLVALVLFGIFTTTTSITVARSYQENQRKLYSINGFYVPEWEYNYLKQNDWNVLVHKNCSDDYIGWGHYYSKDGQRYLHGRNVDGQMEYQLERKEKVIPGLYRLEAVGRTDGAGAYIYAQQGTSVNKQEIPVCGEEQGSIWLDAQKRIAAGGLSVSDSIRYHEICARHDGKGHGWSRVVVDSIVVTTPGELRYGVSNVPAFTGKPWRGTWLSAADFTLTRL